MSPVADDAAGGAGEGREAAGSGATSAGGGVGLPPMVQSLGRRIVAAEVARLTAHEINNHLQGIIGLADLLEEEVPNPAWKASLAQIKTQGEKIAQLQRNLTTLLRGEGTIGEPPQPLDACGLWLRVEPLIRGALARRQTGVQIQAAGNLPAVLGDPETLTQLFVLASLWHLKSLDRRKEWIGVKPQFELSIKAVSETDGTAVEWWSKDNGAGVPAVMKPPPSPEEHPELYDDLSTFGLVQMITTVHQHGGRLATQSDEQTGLELRVTLPAARRA